MKRALVLMAAVVLAGCSSTAATPTTAPTTASGATAAAATPTPAATKQNLTLTVLESQGWVYPSEQALALRFQDLTGIKIDYQIVPSANYFQVLTTKLNSGQGPDIFGGQSGVSDLKVTYNVEKNAVDLSNEAWVKQEDPNAVAQATLNGKVYGQEIWDIYSGYWIITYNKQIFQQAGIAAAPTTYDEFTADCDKIKALGITPIYEPMSDGWHHVLWFPEVGAQMENLEPGLYANLNANKATLATDANALKAMTQFNNLYQKGYFGSSALSATVADQEKNMTTGKFAMTVSNLTLPQSIATDFPSSPASNFGYFPIPLVDNQLLPTHPAGPTKFIWSGSKQIDAAKQYLAFLAQPDSLQYLIDNTDAFATLDFSGVKAKWSADQQAFMTAYKAATVNVLQDDVTYVNPQWMDMGKDEVAMFTGKETPLQVLQAIDKRRTTQATTAKDPNWP
jgi:raffinose/stachyose/melibiose transport system substrate-binding protein